MNFIKKLFGDELSSTGKYPGKAPRILLDYKVKDFNQFIDLFPEAAYEDTEAHGVLEDLREMRFRERGYEVYPEKDNTATYLAVMEEDGQIKVRVTEAWQDADGKLISHATTRWLNLASTEKE